MATPSRHEPPSPLAIVQAGELLAGLRRHGQTVADYLAGGGQLPVGIAAGPLLAAEAAIAGTRRARA
jgi:hypothetical protein